MSTSDSKALAMYAEQGAGHGLPIDTVLQKMLEIHGTAAPSDIRVAIKGAYPELPKVLLSIVQDPAIENQEERHKQMCAAVRQYLLFQGRLYYHAASREHRTAMFFNAEKKLLLDIQSDHFVSWLSNFTGINRSQRAFKFIRTAVEGEALVGCTTARHRDRSCICPRLVESMAREPSHESPV